MVSEDSDQLVPGFLAVHRLSDLSDLDKTQLGQMKTSINRHYTPCELLEVLLLRGTKRILTEERYDRLQKIAPPLHDETIKVLLVVVIPSVDDNLTKPEVVT